MADSGLFGRRVGLLDPIDRISEILFGLFMAVTIVGSLSIASAGQNEVRTVMAAALGCNIAWGLVDGFMHLVRTLTERNRDLALARKVLGTDTEAAHRLILEALPEHVAKITGPAELEGMRRRLMAMEVPLSEGLRGEDYLAAAGIVLLVIAATFPVVVPFLVTRDARLAMDASRVTALAMLFIAGFALGRQAGHPHPSRTGLVMTLLGAALVLAVMALGG